MLQYEELRLKLRKADEPIKELAEALGLKAMTKEIEELELKAAQEEFWNDIENSQKVLQRTAMLKGKVEKYNKLCEDYEDTMTLIELADDEGDRRDGQAPRRETGRNPTRSRRRGRPGRRAQQRASQGVATDISGTRRDEARRL